MNCPGHTPPDSGFHNGERTTWLAHRKPALYQGMPAGLPHLADEC